MNLSAGGNEEPSKSPPAQGTTQGYPYHNNGNSENGSNKSIKKIEFDTRSWDEFIADPFSLLDMQEQIDKVDVKVALVNAQVGPFDSKFKQVLKSISEVKNATPSIQ